MIVLSTLLQVTTTNHLESVRELLFICHPRKVMFW